MNKMHYTSDEENSYQSSFLLDINPILQVNPHRHMLQLTRPGSGTMSTTYAPPIDQQSAQNNLSLQQTITDPVAAMHDTQEANFLAHNPKVTPFIFDFSHTEDKGASRFETAPMRVIRGKRAKKRIGKFFTNLLIMLLGILLLGMLATIIVVIPGSIAKIEAFVIFLIALSYITSSQVKRLHPARKQAYLTSTQLLQVGEDEDMEHLKLIKQDTATYLHELAARDLEKVF